MADELVIRTEALGKEYGRFLSRRRVVALTDLTLEVRRGEIFGLLGPNGSGKTTTLKLLLGLCRPSHGRAVVMDREAGDTAVKARIGFLSEESAFYPFLNATETLDFYARLFGMPRARRRREIDRVLSLVGLGAERRRPLREYSKGMARRVGVAQALINDPELLLMDEPTSGLDPIGAAEIRDVLLELKERGKTIVACSHLLGDVQAVCDRIAVLHRGRLVLCGEAAALLRARESWAIRVDAEGVPAPDELRVALEARGVRVEAVEHPSRTLEDLFREAVRRGAEEPPAGPAPGGP
jgi:ABC-2 type transport system ATP-binding protein